MDNLFPLKANPIDQLLWPRNVGLVLLVRPVFATSDISEGSTLDEGFNSEKRIIALRALPEVRDSQAENLGKEGPASMRRRLYQGGEEKRPPSEDGGLEACSDLNPTVYLLPQNTAAVRPGTENAPSC
jgi:hypothetical protein